MEKNKSILILASYYFSFTIPQYVPGLYLVFDRISIQLLFISVLNLIVFLSIIKNLEFQDFFKKIKYKIHLASYFLVILFSAISLFIADNLVEGTIVLTKFITFFTAFFLILYVVFKSEINFIKYFIYFFVIALILEVFLINYLAFDSVITDGNFLKRTNTFRGLTGNINISSFSVAIKIPIIIYLIYKLKNNLKLFLLLSILCFAILSILILSSRAAIITVNLVLISSLIYFSFKEKKKSLHKSVLIIITVLISTFFYNLINEKNTYNLIEDRFSSITKPYEDN